MNFRIKDIPLRERPREKFKESGFEKLSDADLIAILLRTGTKEMSVRDLATYILKEMGELKEIANTSLETLSKIKGIGEVKAITLLCAVELGIRVNETNLIKGKKIKTTKDLYEMFKNKMERLTQEHLLAVFLNNKNEVITFSTIFIGSANQSIVHPRDIYKEAIKHSAVKLAIIHNHPSGDSTPSKEDFLFTRRMINAGKLLQIPLMEHLIIGHKNYYSFYDHIMK